MKMGSADDKMPSQKARLKRFPWQSFMISPWEIVSDHQGAGAFPQRSAGGERSGEAQAMDPHEKGPQCGK